MKNRLKRLLVFLMTAVMCVSTFASAQAAVLTLPEGIQTIEAETFEGTTALDSVVVPDGVTAIGSRAFAGSSLESITLPRSVTSIADDAFDDCTNVKAVVKSGSYALEYCIAQGIPYEVEAVILPSAGVPVSVSVSKNSVEMGDELSVTFTSDDGSELEAGQEISWSVIYLNEDNVAIDATSHGAEQLGSYYLSSQCAGAAKMIVKLENGNGTYPGKTASAEVKITGSSDYVYYDIQLDGMGYPGGTLRLTVSAVNADKLTSSQTVVVTDNLGSFTKTIGELSKSNSKLTADLTVPADFDVYDENGRENDYYYTITIGNKGEWRYWPWINSFCSYSTSVQVGSSRELDTSIIPVEMPYTYAIDDTSIATIDENGIVTGVKEGTTTGTLTTKTGKTADFKVNVVAAGESEVAQDPIFYVMAPASTYLYGTDNNPIFRIYSDTANSLQLGTDLPMTLNFYDDAENLVGSISDSFWVNTTSTRINVWTSWDWWDNRIGEGYRYVELCLDAEEMGYEVIEPSSARVQVIYPDELGELAFQLDSTWGEYDVGDTVTIPLTCTTPDLLAEMAESGDVKVTAVVRYNANDIINNVQPAVFDADTLTANLTFTVGEDVVAGQYYQVTLYCGADEVGNYGVEIFSGLSRLVSYVDLLTGESCKLPFTLAEGANTDNLYFKVSDPSVATVDQTGIVTAHKAGFTEVEIYYQGKYGNTTNAWISINVYEAAAEDVPTLTVTPISTSAAYGKPVQVKAQLSDLITDENGEPAEVRFRLRTTFLDANSSTLTYYSRNYTYTADELVGDGMIVEVNDWLTSSDLYSLANLMIIPAYYSDVSEYTLDFDYTMIPVTDIPERGEVIYQLMLEDNEISHGQWAYFRVSRVPNTVGADVEITLCDADGNVLCTETFYDGNSNCYLSFDTDDMEPGVTHTVCLYADGVKVEDAAVSFGLEEAELYLNLYDHRMSVGATTDVSYRFSSSAYDCDVTITSSDPTILSIDDENVMTALQPGTATITAACKHGRTSSEEVIVYNPDGTEVPVIGIYEEGSTVNWMSSVRFNLGVSGDLTQVPKEYLYAYYYVQFLDEEQNVIYDSREKDGLVTRDGYTGVYDAHLSLTSTLQYDSYNYQDDWIKGAELGARYIRLKLTMVGTGSYEIDSEHNQITFALPDITEYDRPIVKYDYSSAIGEGDPIEVTFTCLNPNSLTESREVVLKANDGSTVLAQGILTKSNPSVTLSYTPDASFSSGWFYITYPQQYGTTTQGFQVTVSILKSIGSNAKMAVGNYRSFYPSFSGAMQEITYTVSDDTIASIEMRSYYGSSYLYVTALKAGTVTITGTTTSGQSQSLTVIVYDPDNTAIPNVYVVQDQAGQQVEWERTLNIAVGTTSDPSTFGNVYLQGQLDYLDASGNVIDSEDEYLSPENSFTDPEDYIELYFSNYDLAQAYAKGARSLRFTLTESDSYTIDESRSSVTLNFADPAAEEDPIIYFVMPDYVIDGETFTVEVGCLNPETMTEAVECEIYHVSSDTRTVTLTADSPTAEVAFEVSESSNEYMVYFCANGYGIYNYIPVLDGYINNSGTLAVGGTRQLSYYCYVQVDEFTAVWESANPEIATVDQDGLVTGVAPGQTDILVHYGPLTLTGSVRVYDSGVEYVAPEFYITTTTEMVKPGSGIQYVFGTTTDLADLTNSSYYIYCSVTGLNDADEVVYVRNTNWSKTCYFAEGSEAADSFYFGSDDLAKMVASGATKICFTLLENSNYTIDSERSSIVVPIQNASEWTSNNIVVLIPSAVASGEEVEIPVKWVSSSSAYAEKTCTVTLNVSDQNDNYLIENEPVTISKAAPDAAVSFTVPEDATSLTVTYSYSYEGSTSTTNGSGYVYVMYFTSTPKDFAMAVGTSDNLYYSGNALYNVTPTYESSDPAVATVDANGNVTGVAAGTATITTHYGALTDTVEVRVYDAETMVDAKLSLSAPQELTEWPWTGEGDLVITADQPVESLGYVNYVYIYSYYLDENGNQLAYETNNYYPAFVNSNTETIHITNTNMLAYASQGAVSVRHKLSSVSGSGFSVDSEAASITLPMQSLSDTADPMIYVKETLSSTTMISGKEYTMTVAAANTTVSTPQTVTAYATISGTRYDLGTVTFTPSESAEATLTITAPSGVTVSSFTMYVNVPKGNDVYENLSRSYYCNLTALPSVTAVTTLADLQSEHNYANNLNQAWSYTVDGAVSLSVTFDAQTQTESSGCDPLKIASLDAFEAGNPEHTYGGSIGAITVDVTGDTVVIWLKSDYSVTYYGFAVTQIVATMADGSTVTITE